MGDVVSLVEKAAETIQAEEAEALAARMAKGQFDLNDLRSQLQQMQRMGGLGALAGMMPGHEEGQAGDRPKRGWTTMCSVGMDAIIGSMTPKERAQPELLNAKRKIRVAKGSGTTVQDVNKLLKMHQEMAERDEADQEDGRPPRARRAVRRRRHGRAGRRAAWAVRAGQGGADARPRRRRAAARIPRIFQEDRRIRLERIR